MLSDSNGIFTIENSGLNIENSHNDHVNSTIAKNVVNYSISSNINRTRNIFAQDAISHIYDSNEFYFVLFIDIFILFLIYWMGTIVYLDNIQYLFINFTY